jgi:hypothetical protein
MDSMTTPYDEKFFEQMDNWAVQSAAVIAPLVHGWLRPRSILDVGGGRGGWSAAFAHVGVEDYLCVDGGYVDRSSLRIPTERFREADLSRPFHLGRRYDLALCLEVGEHLPESSADQLVSSLVQHADAVLFSAAAPLQGGTSHVNEQWPAYWASKFDNSGFACFDCVRWKVWDNPSVAWWYRQNTVLFLNPSGVARLPTRSPISDSVTLSPPGVVHPEAYLSVARGMASLRSHENIPSLPWALKAVVKAARASLRYHSGMQ